MPPTLSARDVRALFTLEGELSEVAAHSHRDAVSHFAAELPRVLGGDAVVWWSAMSAPGVPVTSRVFGLEPSVLRRWEESYLLEGEYAAHPMWPGLFESGAANGLTRRREELVRDADWYRSPHIAEWCRGLGYDDVLANVAPLAPSGRSAARLGFVAVVRPWGQARFTQREADVLEVAQHRTRWLTQAAVLDERAARHEALRAKLPPHLKRVRAQLLLGHSEKEIAARLGLSPRTVHKYVENLYAAFDVQSRPQFMALWVDPSAVD